jgi:hypothetical protein
MLNCELNIVKLLDLKTTSVYSKVVLKGKVIKDKKD